MKPIIVMILPFLALQEEPPSFPVAPENKRLEFWAGDWEASGKLLVNAKEEKWVDNKATNKLRWILGGQVIHEDFSDGTLVGQSWTRWVPEKKAYEQTWVDNMGSLLRLEGDFKGDDLVLFEKPADPKAKVRHRMVFSSIQKDSFQWSYDFTTDDGNSWKSQWQLSYKRRKAG